MGSQCGCESKPTESVAPEAEMKVNSEAEPAPEAKAGHIHWSVRLLFALPDGSERSVEVLTKSLGCDWQKEVPLAIGAIHPGGQAEELKVQLGWKLKEIDGEAVWKASSPDAILKVLDKALSPLPEK